MSFANAGIPVTLIETGEEQAEARQGVMQRELRGHSRARRHPGGRPGQALWGPDQRGGRHRNVKDADLVIEAVFETMAIKKEVFEKLDKYAKPGARAGPPIPRTSTSTKSRSRQNVRRTCSACISFRRQT